MSNGRSGRPVPTLAPNFVNTPSDQPRQLTEPELALAVGAAAPAPRAAAVVARPVLEPPGLGVTTAPAGMAAGMAVGAAAFQSVRVLALFSTGAHANGWALLEGIGWKRIATANDSAHTTLGLLAAAARIGGNAATIRHESDNQIHEIYVW